MSTLAAGDSHLLDIDPGTGATVERPARAADASAVLLDVGWSYLEGRQEVDVTLERDGRELWSERLPGFVVALHDDVVVVIAAMADAAGRKPAPRRACRVDDRGSLRHGPVRARPETGELVWERDVGSPGGGGRYSEPGPFGFFEFDADASNTLVGVVLAQEPCRD